MFRNKSVDVHQFAMVPRAEIPRSAFDRQFTHKTTFNSGFLIPVFVDEVLPGDTFKLRMTAFARLSTPIFPIMDNLHMDSFFFFVPNRLVWSNWRKFMGEQANPSDSISFVVPQTPSPVGGFHVGELHDFFGLPTVGQVGAGNTVRVCSFFHRAYNLIYNEWFRDENLVNSVHLDTGDADDNWANYVLLKRGKRHDYFTSCLPWPQKGGVSVSLPLGTAAPVFGNGKAIGLWDGTNPFGLISNAGSLLTGGGAAYAQPVGVISGGAAPPANVNLGVITAAQDVANPSNNKNSGLFADLSQATAATINQLRQAFQIQKLLERDARGGTRYTEIVRAHFGVVSPDARLQRPEYLGGGSQMVAINPIAQTSATGVTGGSTAQGNLAAMGTVLAQGHGFSQSFTEHGVILGLVSVRADLTYQQGMRRMWSRQTRYDFYFPAFAMLGEQAVLSKEIYATGDAQDNDVFGYQERWAEYRYLPSMITGLFRSTSAGTIDPWHLAQRFVARPVLNDTFILESPPVQRALAVGAAASGKEFIFDAFFDVRTVRPMPMYSVPGLIDHF